MSSLQVKFILHSPYHMIFVFSYMAECDNLIFTNIRPSVAIGDSDVGDIVMLVTLWWWLISDVGGRIIMLATFFVMSMIFSMYWIGHQHPKSVTNMMMIGNISSLSPTHLVSVTNIDATYLMYTVYWIKLPWNRTRITYKTQILCDHSRFWDTCSWKGQLEKMGKFQVGSPT